MQKKNAYITPSIESESFHIGVFGDYGEDGNDGCDFTPVNFLNPLFGWCCS